MLKPSIDELLSEIHSRFALTIVIAKRARQLQLNPSDYKVGENAVGRDNNEVAKALEELNADKLDYYLSAESAAAAKELSFDETEYDEDMSQEEI
jgi:DNA-directed RNA polymerase omega subunit